MVDALMAGSLRFNDLAEAVEGIAPNVLSRRLRDLESHGVVVATPYCERPPRMIYELTAAGRELAGALRLLAWWGAAQADSGEALRHQACGTPLEARWFCPTCARPVQEADTTDVTVL